LNFKFSFNIRTVGINGFGTQMKPAGDLDALSMAGRCSTGILWRFVGLMGYLREAPSGESLVGPEVD
jgi:hypothetical protein